MTTPVPIPASSPPTDLGGWFHDISPYVLRFSEDFGIRWYGLSYIAGFVIAYVLLRWLSKRGFTPIPKERVFDAIVVLVMGTVLGGRLGYILIYKPSLLWTFSHTPPWWSALAINNGGMASHGAFIGLIIAAWWVSRGFKDEQGNRIGACPPLHVMDLLSLLGMAGYSIGRVANFINGELLGRIVAAPGEHAPWWGVRFPQEILTDHRPELTFEQQLRLDALIDEFAHQGDTIPQASQRVLDALWRGAPDVQARLEPLISARHPSQLYQSLEGVIVGLIVWWIARKPRLPGVIGCWFLITYGAARITTEIWRLPDDHLKVQRPLGLSRGQWLSAAMILAGAFILTIITKRGGAKMGGWRHPTPTPPSPSTRAADEQRESVGQSAP
ncbi:MAG: prolipoprotein diacylglyceryl transferase [Phycisphaerales bacterium]